MKKDVFKFLIKEFHETPFIDVLERDLELPATKKIISLIGSRRAGKTFYFYQLMKALVEANKKPKDRVIYINFEDERILPLEVTDLNDLLEAYYELYPSNKGKEIYFFFDEIQNIKNWEVFVRRLNDKENAKIFVTGSSSKLLSKEIATALRGRTLTFQLFPLSFREFLRFQKIELKKDFEYSSARFKIKKAFEEYLEFGGFPEVTLEKQTALKHKIMNNYFELMIYCDLVERFSIRNTSLLRNLTKFLITNISNVFSINAYYRVVSKEMAVGKDTILEYVSYLEDINLIYLIPVFSYSVKKQQLNPKKAYCVDSGLRNAVAFKFSKDEGKLAENIAFIDLKRKEKEVFFWKNKNEVDFIIKSRDNSLEAINVSYTNEIDEREIKGLMEFKKEFKKTKKLTILTKDTEKKESGIDYVPLWKWLLKK
jgi:uncharacterized protein